MESDEYRVEKILDKRICDGVPYYLIKWADYSEDQNTWEPLCNLYCRHLVEQFDMEHNQMLNQVPVQKSTLSATSTESGHTSVNENSSTNGTTSGSSSTETSNTDTDNETSDENLGNGNVTIQFKNLQISQTGATGVIMNDSPIQFLESFDRNMKMISPIHSIGDDEEQHNGDADYDEKLSKYSSLLQSPDGFNSSVDLTNDNSSNLVINISDLSSSPSSIVTNYAQEMLAVSSTDSNSMISHQTAPGTPSCNESEVNENVFNAKPRKKKLSNSPNPLLMKAINNDKKRRSSSVFRRFKNTIDSSRRRTDSVEHSFLVNEGMETTVGSLVGSHPHPHPYSPITTDSSRSEETSSNKTHNDDIETNIMLPQVTSSIYSPTHSPKSSLGSDDEMKKSVPILSKNTKNGKKKKDILKLISNSPIYSSESNLQNSIDLDDPSYIHDVKDKDKFGYDRGLKLRKIDKLIKFDELLYYVVYWHGLKDSDIVSVSEICKKNPYETLQFLEGHARKLTTPRKLNQNIIQHDKVNVPEYKMSTNTKRPSRGRNSSTRSANTT